MNKKIIISLLVFLPVALVLPSAVNAAPTNTTTVYTDSNSEGTVFTYNGGVGTTTNTAATAWILSDQGGFNSTFRNLTAQGTTNSFFSVVVDTPLFSATMNSNVFSTGMTPRLIDVTTGSTIAINIDPETGMYVFDALVSGQVYDIQVAYNVAARTTASVYTTITVAAVPELEEWAMMLIGLFLIAAKVNKSIKSENQLSHLRA